MTEAVVRTKLKSIAALRALFLQENNFQVRYDAYHQRGWTDSYLVTVDGHSVGYGSIQGQERNDRDTVFEFYVIPAWRKRASRLFARLLSTCGAKFITCQSNHPLLCGMLYEFSRNIRADTILFADHACTEHVIPGAMVRPRRPGDRVFDHHVEPVGEYVVEAEGQIVATGGFLTHYNPPFADLYMEVRSDSRGRGFGSFLLQEVKKACYLSGKVPAARCNIDNRASRATLVKAGMKVCGYMLLGDVEESVVAATLQP